MNPTTFRFRSHDTIGVADAEADNAFLKECFVDTGDLEFLLDCEDHRRIVLGRTGAGKTALLSQLPTRSPRVIAIAPESLALSYVSNSNILQFVHGVGVNLDTFFKLLWRHVFTVEVIKAHFHLDGPDAKEGLIDWLRNLFSDKKRQYEKALKYLEQWGSKFWEQTDYRIKDLTTKLETELKASIGTGIIIPKAGVSASTTLSQEEKAEVVQRAQYVVNQVQIQELSYVLDLLDGILDDPQSRYYVVIDRLDENWVEEGLRHLLIRALIETVRDFRKVRNAKIILALRYDLIDRVIRISRTAGFQEEKYESLFLELNWTKDQLIKVLDSRIDHLVKQSYTKDLVTHRDLLPRTIDGMATIDYIVRRTLMRPRDIIMFFNACIKQATDTPQISTQMVKEAEGEYSRQRLRSLADEWYTDYPQLMGSTELLKGRRSHFTLSEVALEDCLDLAVKLLADPSITGEQAEILRRVESDPTCVGEYRRWLFAMFYRVGLVGLKLASFETTVWSYSKRRSVSATEITDGTRINIHPCFWRTLGVNPSEINGKGAGRHGKD
jgi:hypothetical protein